MIMNRERAANDLNLYVDTVSKALIALKRAGLIERQPGYKKFKVDAQTANALRGLRVSAPPLFTEE